MLLIARRLSDTMESSRVMRSLAAILWMFLAIPAFAQSPYPASPDGTQVCSGGGLIVDNAGNIWGIVPGSYSQVAYNGKIISYTLNVDTLAKAQGGAIWQHGSNNWWQFGPPDASGVPTTKAGPIAGSPVSAKTSIALQIKQAQAMLAAALTAASGLNP